MLIPHVLYRIVRFHPIHGSFSDPAFQNANKNGVIVQHIDCVIRIALNSVSEDIEDIIEGLLVGELLELFGD